MNRNVESPFQTELQFASQEQPFPSRPCALTIHTLSDDRRRDSNFESAVKLCVIYSSPIGFHKSRYCSEACFNQGSLQKQRDWWVAKHPPKGRSERLCVKCGAEFQGHVSHKFCSDKCRATFYYQKYSLQKPRVKAVIEPINCSHCQCVFTPKVRLKSVKFCSKKCAYKAQCKKNSKKRYLKRKARLQVDPIYRARINKLTSLSICRRLKKDPVLRIKMGLRKRIRDLLRQRPTESISGLVGCSKLQLREHLQSLFTAGMAWNNYGSFWVVDHKIPLAAFDLQNPEHRAKACHFTNLQPLTREANMLKGDSLPEGFIPFRQSNRTRKPAQAGGVPSAVHTNSPAVKQGGRDRPGSPVTQDVKTQCIAAASLEGSSSRQTALTSHTPSTFAAPTQSCDSADARRPEDTSLILGI